MADQEGTQSCSSGPALRPGRSGLRAPLIAALSRLARVAPKLCLILAQAEADCEEIRRMRFAAVWTSRNVGSRATQVPDFPETFVGIVVLSLGEGIQELLGVVNGLDALGDIPPCLAVLLRPGCRPSHDFQLEALESRAIFEAGADDVISLFDERELTPGRVMTGIMRTEVMVARASELIAQHVDKENKKQSQKSKSLAREFLWSLADSVLESIPKRDSSLQVNDEVREGSKLGPYNVVCALGSGAFGVVLKAEHSETGAVRALKVMCKSRIQNLWELNALDKELCMLQNLEPHPNVIRAYGAIHTRDFIIMVMGFAGDLSLHRYIVQTQKEQGWDNLPVPQLESFCKQAARGVAHLHTWQICHRDIKPDNFIVSCDGQHLHLADFGFACRVISGRQKLHSWCGSLPFVAPEVLRLRGDPKSGAGYDGLAADVWSLGVSFIELCLGIYSTERLLGWSPCLPSKFEDQLQDLIMFPMFCNSGLRIPVPRVARLIDYMLRLRPEDRVGMDWVVGPEGLDLV